MGHLKHVATGTRRRGAEPHHDESSSRGQRRAGAPPTWPRGPAPRRRAIAAAVTGAVALLGAFTPAAASAADDGPAPLIHYTFDDATGPSIPDTSGNGYDATLRRTGAQVAGGVLSLPGGSATAAPYLEIPTAGLVGQQDLTISTWLSPRSGAGNTAAAFIGAPVASGAQHSTAYWLLNPTNPSGYVKSVVTNTVNATSPWTTEVGPGSTNAATSGIRTPAGMALYTTVIDGTSRQLSVYVNGAPVGQVAIDRDVASFGSDLVAYLGRSTYADAGWNGTVDELAVYGQALDAAQVGELFAGQAIDKAVASLVLPASTTADLTLPTLVYGTTVTWESDDPAIQVDGGTGVVTRPAAGSGAATVTLTATFTAGESTRTVTYAVEVPEDAAASDKAAQDLAALQLDGLDDVRTNFSVPTTGEQGSSISWSVRTEDADHVTVRDGVTPTSRTIAVERPAAGTDPVEVVLTATATNGDATQTREFVLRLRPMPSGTDQTEAYVWAFFTGEGDGAEQVSLAASRGNDALAWNTLNDGQPLFVSDEGTQGLRDPFIIRAPEGDRFYMIATDLKVAGLPGGFTTAQLSGSLHIEVWESDDLVTWSEQRHVKVSSDYAGNTWAPEAFWSDELDTFVVFWASNLYPTTNPAERSAVTYNRMMYATTDDFVTFSEARPWIDVRRGNGRGMIDSTVAQIDDTYYRFTKDEASMTIRAEKSTDLLATVSGSLPGTTGAADEWTLIKERIATGLPNGEPGGTFTSGEGPNLFRANEGDVNDHDWFLFIDQPDYHGGPNYYIPFGSDDLDDGDSWEPVGAKLRENLPQNADGGKPRHGTVIPVTRAEYQKVLEAYAPDIAVTSVAAMEVTTSPGVAPTLPRAELTMADGSAQTVDVDWAEIDPAAYASPGSFTVTGVAQDASRATVEVTVLVEAGTPMSLSTATRCVRGAVVLTVTVSSSSDGPLDTVVRTPFGQRTAVLEAGRTVTSAFSSREGTLPAITVSATATAADGSTTSAEASSSPTTCA
ncbi:Ig-like domain-containing protein [Actinotalea sp. BY-33]|uniref:Ig-like domain-containing protein n=1 Tax=Actinotalea soli TaxID=2819234 RepID=A0A939RU21_9CELL|nr:immunoglobulin-like domain-containing protein [Actinotalea soli]MBO1752079.1 Ig-like domain-containing protein [Actinotalea soli]